MSSDHMDAGTSAVRNTDYHWFALPRLKYGHVRQAYVQDSSDEDEAFAFFPGDEVYVFEELFYGKEHASGSHESAEWFRGYVVSRSLCYPNLDPNRADPKDDEADVTIGIFPSKYVKITEELESQFPEDTEFDKDSGLPVAAVRESAIDENETENRPAPPLPSLKTNDISSLTLTEPLVDDISATLYSLGLACPRFLVERGYSRFAFASILADALEEQKRMLSSGTLSRKEAQKTRAKICSALAVGGIALGGSITVRDPTRGTLVTGKGISAPSNRDDWTEEDQESHNGLIDGQLGPLQLARLQAYLGTMDLKCMSGGNPSLPNLDEIAQTMTQIKALSAPKVRQHGQASRAHLLSTAVPKKEDERLQIHYQILLEVEGIEAGFGPLIDHIEMIFSLYSLHEQRFLTEEFITTFKVNGQPRSGFDSTGRLRTIFRDLSKEDVDSDVYLICRAVKVLTAQKVSTAEASDSIESSPNPGSEATSIAASSLKMSVRRPLGAGVVALNQIVTSGFASSSMTNVAGMALTVPLFVGRAEENFSTLHEDIISSRTKAFQSGGEVDSVSVSVKCLHTSASEVIRHLDTAAQQSIEFVPPSLAEQGNLAISKRLGFADAAFPSDARNDLYLRIGLGQFLSPVGRVVGVLEDAIGQLLRSVSVSLEVRTQDGKVVPGCLSRGGEPGQDSIQSLVFYRNSHPNWNELLRIDLENPEIEKAHIFITFTSIQWGNDKGVSSANAMARRRSSMGLRKVRIEAPPPFAFGYLPLFRPNGNFQADNAHSLALYKWDNNAVASNMYLARPFLRSDTMQLETSAPNLLLTRDGLTVRSFLCSTTYTQNDHLLHLLRWQKHWLNIDAIRQGLRNVAKINEIELAKFLQPVLDAHFLIMTSSRNVDGVLDEALLLSLARILNIVRDPRFKQFRSVLLDYEQKRFRHHAASQHLISALSAKVRGALTRSFVMDDLTSIIKAWPFIFKFTIRSILVQDSKEGTLGLEYTEAHIQQQTIAALENVLSDLIDMMTHAGTEQLATIQTLALQQFPETLIELEEVLPKQKILNASIQFVDASQHLSGQAKIQRMACMCAYFDLPLFASPEARGQLTSYAVRWLKKDILDDDSSTPDLTMTMAKKQTKQLARLQTVRGFLAVIASVLQRLQDNMNLTVNKSDQTADRYALSHVLELLPILCELYDEVGTQQQTAMIEDHLGSQLRPKYPTLFAPFDNSVFGMCLASSDLLAGPDKRELVNIVKVEAGICIASLIHLSSRKQLVALWDEENASHDKTALADNLSSILFTVNKMLSPNAMPKSWFNLLLWTHLAIVRLLKSVLEISVIHFVGHGDANSSIGEGPWVALFAILIRLAESDIFQIERLNPADRKFTWVFAADIRFVIANLLYDTWNSLIAQYTPHEVNSQDYLSSLTSVVAPEILPSCFSHHEGIRTSATHILHSMLATHVKIKGLVTVEMKNSLVESTQSQAHHDEITRDMFVRQMEMHNAAVSEPISKAITPIIVLINNVTGHLVQALSLPRGQAYSDDRCQSIILLLTELYDNASIGTYAAYINRLVQIQLDSGNYIEAALTLKFLADRFAWDETVQVEMLEAPNLSATTSFKRRETLYKVILHYFVRAEVWESAAAVCQALAEQYQYNTFDYSSLGAVLRAKASLFDNIVNQSRTYPLYFCVRYRGSAFADSIRDRQLIYRGRVRETYAQFIESLRDLHPEAEIMKLSAIVPANGIDGKRGEIQVALVQPESDQGLSVFTTPNVPESVQEYYRRNNVNRFSCLQTKSNDVISDEGGSETLPKKAKIATARYIYVTQDIFPNHMKRSEVTEIMVETIRPIESAIKDIEGQSAELQKSVTQLQISKVYSSQFTMQLNTILDVPSNRSYRSYRTKFAAELSDSEDELGGRLRQALEDLAVAIDNALAAHNKLSPPEMRAFHEILNRFFRDNFAEEIVQLQLDTIPDPEFRLDASTSQTHIFDVNVPKENSDVLIPEGDSRPLLNNVIAMVLSTEADPFGYIYPEQSGNLDSNGPKAKRGLRRGSRAPRRSYQSSGYSTASGGESSDSEGARTLRTRRSGRSRADSRVSRATSKMSRATTQFTRATSRASIATVEKVSTIARRVREKGGPAMKMMGQRTIGARTYKAS